MTSYHILLPYPIARRVLHMYFYAKYYQEITVAEALATQRVSLNTMITDRTG